MAPSMAQYFKVCETSSQRHTELKVMFYSQCTQLQKQTVRLGRAKESHTGVQQKGVSMFVREAEGGREGC